MDNPHQHKQQPEPHRYPVEMMTIVSCSVTSRAEMDQRRDRFGTKYPRITKVMNFSRLPQFAASSAPLAPSPAALPDEESFRLPNRREIKISVILSPPRSP